MRTGKDPDYIPAPLGLVIFLLMICVAGAVVGYSISRPLGGVIFTLGAIAFLVICGLFFYDRLIRH